MISGSNPMGELIQRLKPCCLEFPEIELAILFGSMATGKASSESDLDIGVAGPAAIDWRTKMRLVEAISLVALRPVDLVDLRTASGTLLHQILTTGEIILCRNHTLYADLIKKMLFDQADFQPMVRRIFQERRKKWIGV